MRDQGLCRLRGVAHAPAGAYLMVHVIPQCWIPGAYAVCKPQRPEVSQKDLLIRFNIEMIPDNAGKRKASIVQGYVQCLERDITAVIAKWPRQYGMERER